MTDRPTPEQVILLAPDRRAAAAATEAADPGAWSAAGCDQQAVWGRYIAGSAEPYEVSVALQAPAYRCTCPSRKIPCKHCLGLMLLYAHHRVGPARRLHFVDEWLDRLAAVRDRTQDAPPSAPVTMTAPVAEVDHSAALDHGEPGAASGRGAAPGAGAVSGEHGVSSPDPARERRRTDRAERMRAGLGELDRWLADRIRHGLAAPELTDAAAWEQLTARLVDAQCGSLANRMNRIAARVGSHSRWHDDVLEEFALVHALVRGALRTWALPDDLCDGVHAATGLAVAKSDVLAGVPTTATWTVVGESQTREDRITVRRTWFCRSVDEVRGDRSARWALELGFAALGGDSPSEHRPGASMVADVHWYPGAVRLRAVVGRVHRVIDPPVVPSGADTVDDAVAEAGRLVAGEPWIERLPVFVAATPIPVGDGRWMLGDSTGAVPIAPGFRRLAELVAVSGGAPVTVMGEYSSDGLLPLTVFTPTQAVAL